MSTIYYYLAASLPYLKYGRELPIKIEDFLFECAKWVSESEISILQKEDVNSLVSGPDDLAVLRDWREFQLALRETIAGLRQAKQTGAGGRQTSVYSEIFEQPTPLLMEKRLEEINWNFLEQLESCYFADINWLVVYLFKLQIISRLAQFKKDRGWQVFHQLCEVKYG